MRVGPREQALKGGACIGTAAIETVVDGRADERPDAQPLLPRLSDQTLVPLLVEEHPNPAAQRSVGAFYAASGGES